MEDFKVFYDEKEDVLYLGKEGQEEEVVELAPGINVEFDDSGELIGVELFNASTLCNFARIPRAVHGDECLFLGVWGICSPKIN